MYRLQGCDFVQGFSKEVKLTDVWIQTIILGSTRGTYTNYSNLAQEMDQNLREYFSNDFWFFPSYSNGAYPTLDSKNFKKRL